MRGKRVKVSESHTLMREKAIRVRAWRGKGELHSEGRGGSKEEREGTQEELPKKVEGSMSG